MPNQRHRHRDNDAEKTEYLVKYELSSHGQLTQLPRGSIFLSVKWETLEQLICISLWLVREKAMAPHSRTVARKIPWMEEPGRLQSMGSLRVRHDWATSLSLSTFMHWRRKWQPTPVFLPGESHGWRSLVGCSPWGRTESDTTESTWQHGWSKFYQWIKFSSIILQKFHFYERCKFPNILRTASDAKAENLNIFEHLFFLPGNSPFVWFPHLPYKERYPISDARKHQSVRLQSPGSPSCSKKWRN